MLLYLQRQMMYMMYIQEVCVMYVNIYIHVHIFV